MKMAAKFPRADHLTNEEVDYELIIRGKRDETKDELNAKHRLLRNLFFEDVRENKTYTSRYTMDQEYDYIASKLDVLGKRLQKGLDDKSISRLKHYLMRVERCVAEDPRSLQLRDELSQEIKTILNRFSFKDAPTKETLELEQECGAVGGEEVFSQISEHTDRVGDSNQDKYTRNEENSLSTFQNNASRNSLGAIAKTDSVLQKQRSQTDLELENEALKNKIYMLEKQLAKIVLNTQSSVENCPEQIVSDRREYTANPIEIGCQEQEPLGYSSRRNSLRGESQKDRDYRASEPVRREYRNGEVDNRISQGRRLSLDVPNPAFSRTRQNDQFENRRNEDFFRETRRNQLRYEPSEHSDRGVREIGFSQVRENNDRGTPVVSPGHAQRNFSRRNDFRNSLEFLGEGNDFEYTPREPIRRPINEIEIVNADRRMEKWHLTFSGDSRQRSLEDFLHKVRRLARMDRINENILLQRIHTILRGEAYDWYLCYSDEFVNWEDFEERIRYMYGNPNKDQGNRQKIYERKQQRNETFLAFKMELERLNKLLSTPLDQGRLFEIIWDNMRPHYRSKLACITVRDLNMLEYYAYRIDANDPSLRQREGPTKVVNTVHNIEVNAESEKSYSSGSETEEVNEIGRKFDRNKRASGRAPTGQQSRVAQENLEDRNVPLCWNCNKNGHLWRYCKEPKRIFCYACGNPGKTTVSCPNHARDNSGQSSVQHSGN